MSVETNRIAAIRHQIMIALANSDGDVLMDVAKRVSMSFPNLLWSEFAEAVGRHGDVYGLATLDWHANAFHEGACVVNLSLFQQNGQLISIGAVRKEYAMNKEHMYHYLADMTVGEIRKVIRALEAACQAAENLRAVAADHSRPAGPGAVSSPGDQP